MWSLAAAAAASTAAMAATELLSSERLHAQQRPTTGELDGENSKRKATDWKNGTRIYIYHDAIKEM